MSINSDLVTVITPAYNASDSIERAISSVLNQTYHNWEMLIIDDASTDDTISIVQAISKNQPRINLIQLKENKGPAYARNVGLNTAKGRFIAFLDSDDEWYQDKLKKQIAFMKSNDIAFSYTGYNRVKIIEDKFQVRSVNIPNQVSYKKLLKKNVIGCLTVMIDINKTGNIQMPNIRARQDYALWLELTRKGFIAKGLQEHLANYFVRHTSLSSNKFKMAKQNWRVYRDIEKIGFIKSLWYFTHYAVLKGIEYLFYIG